MTEPTFVSQVLLPAGEYFLGDPCYTISTDIWSDWLNDARNLDPNTLVARVDGGSQAMAFSTRYGDGVYALVKDNQIVAELPVDSGLIGLVPVSVADTSGEALVHRVTFALPVMCSEVYGVMTFNHYTIDTNLPDWIDWSNHHA